jgi:hypothetical protein
VDRDADTRLVCSSRVTWWSGVASSVAAWQTDRHRVAGGGRRACVGQGADRLAQPAGDRAHSPLGRKQPIRVKLERRRRCHGDQPAAAAIPEQWDAIRCRGGVAAALRGCAQCCSRRTSEARPGPQRRRGRAFVHDQLTRVLGPDTFVAVGTIPADRLVTPATGIPEDVVRSIKRDYLDPAEVDVEAWSADPDTLVVPHAGEVLFRLR